VVESSKPKREVHLYMENAHRMLAVAANNLDATFYGSAVNRAYYAVFYAANALLATRDISRSRHSGVLAAFRESFVHTGLIEAEYSRIYGQVMDDRHVSDYEIDLVFDAPVAMRDLQDARRFVTRVDQLLRQEGWL
jgi:uncharacterized protein (UPF0332 family)